MVTLTIDGNQITVPEGTSIMRAAMEAGTQIPKLCATDMVDAFGSCRLCLCEVEGRAGTRIVGLIDAASKTRGTQHTLSIARSGGFNVTQFVWGAS